MAKVLDVEFDRALVQQAVGRILRAEGAPELPVLRFDGGEMVAIPEYEALALVSVALAFLTMVDLLPPEVKTRAGRRTRSG